METFGFVSEISITVDSQLMKADFLKHFGLDK